ncbi:MAG: hypothetical protein JNL77_03120 [Nitrosomonas sp.]|nr:hypothetical protein [Nitrosomonas sp.]
MILSPYFWLAVFVAALAIFGTGYHNGYKHANDHADALKLQAVEKAKKKAIEQARADFETAQRYEKARETVRTVYVKAKEKARENIEKHPEYADCGLDADGLRLYNERPGRTENPPGVLDSRVSGFAGSLGWQVIDDLNRQPGALATLLRLPSAPQGAVGVGGVAGEGKGQEIAQALDAP